MHNNTDTDLCPYISKDTAVRNLGGMEWLYDKHVINFISTYADSAAQLEQLMAEGQTAEARRLVHTVKGLAGTLGFSRLYCAAAELEKAILESSNSLDHRLAFYNLRLKESFAMIKLE